jgi:hypothetical protein
MDFLIYLLESKRRNYSKIMLCPKPLYLKNTVNSEIESIIHNYTWKLVNLLTKSRPLGHTWSLKIKR